MRFHLYPFTMIFMLFVSCEKIALTILNEVKLFRFIWLLLVQLLFLVQLWFNLHL
jgi:hypothetical protein